MKMQPLFMHRLLLNIRYTHSLCIRQTDGKITPRKLVQYWQKRFKEHGVPEPLESSEIIVSHALGSKTFHSLLPAVTQCPVSADQLKCIESMAQQRLKRIPVQYIIGVWDFLDLTLQMRPPVFIPRPETEELVGFVLEGSRLLHCCSEPLVLEVGCGTGAVSLALLQRIPQARVIAVDKTNEAVSLTKDNAVSLGLQDKIQVLVHDILTDSPENLLSLGALDVVISNPPYIPTSDMSQLEPEIFRYEDHTALDGGPDGMDVIRGLLQIAPQLLKPGGHVFLEVDPRHPAKIQQWVENHPDIYLQHITTVRDFCGRPRFVHLHRQ
ncbi:hypothetical protein GDO86_007304 [Hymenochirus boettgeri]|uniref:Peptide chain release factor N(5)-glutamine methyltransferase n=1 Tax=Hymenochirus boettgeri TaxID=247094 RepID=A0A8T2IX72_9PIPI|nr:hypothetical protein GDO86_007304 [Hymenochirus boettgeri]